MSTPSSENIYLGAGEVFFDRIDNLTGKYTGERHLGNCTAFNVSHQSEVKKKYSSMHAARTLYKQIITQISSSGKITIDEYDPENLALGLFGESGVYTQEAATSLLATLEVRKNRWFALGKYKVKDVVVANTAPAASSVKAAKPSGTVSSTGSVTSGGTYSGTTDDTYYITLSTSNTTPGDIAGTKFRWKKGLAGEISDEVTVVEGPITLAEGVTVTFTASDEGEFDAGDTWGIEVVAAETANFVEGVDYKVDYKLGRIFIMPDGDIADKDTIYPRFGCEQCTISKVMAGNTAKIEGFLRFRGDPTTGPTQMGEFWHVSIQPDGEVGFIADDWGSIGISFECMDQRDKHPEEPFFRILNL